MPKTVLVTGGTGWIASWIIIELLRRCYEIRTSVRSLEREAAVRFRIAACADAGGSLSFVAADLAREDDRAEVVRGCDGVIHVASPLGTSGAADRERWVWMADIARILRTELGDQARKVPTRRMPDLVMRLAGLFDRRMWFFVPSLGKKNAVTSAKAERILAWKPRPVSETIIDCAHSLVAVGALS